MNIRKDESNSRLIGGKRYLDSELTLELLIQWRIEVKSSLPPIIKNAERRLADLERMTIQWIADHNNKDLPDTGGTGIQVFDPEDKPWEQEG